MGDFATNVLQGRIHCLGVCLGLLGDHAWAQIGFRLLTFLIILTKKNSTKTHSPIVKKIMS